MVIMFAIFLAFDTLQTELFSSAFSQKAL